MTKPPVDSAYFRSLMGRFATGVTVVTVTDSEGSPMGMTVNSLSSISLDPPLVSVCIDHSAGMHRVLTESPGFVINVLAADQEPLSRQFAEGRPDRFDGVGHHPDSMGNPVLEGVLAHFECVTHSTIEAGDHTLFLGLVVGGATGTGVPLLFYRGGYGLDSV